MSIFSQYKEQHPELNAGKTQKTDGASTAALNLPIKCLAYDGDILVGTRLDTQEEIRIRLRDIDQNPTSKYKRIEIKVFADSKSKHHAVPGKAVFVAENCYHEDGNNYSSRWLKVISADPQQTAVHVMNSSLVFIKKKDKDSDTINEFIFARTVYPEKAKVVENLEELENALSSMLNPKHIGSNPFCYVRIKDKDSGEVEFVEVLPLRTEREDGNGKKCVEGAKSAKNFLEASESQMIRDLLSTSSDKVIVDVIPAAVIYPGSSTKENMVNSHPNAKKILEESFFIKSSEEEETGSRPEIGYLKCIIATRKHADGTSYFTFMKPVQQFLKPTSVKNI